MIATKINNETADLIKEMELYLEKLKSLDPKEAKKEARESLIRSGILSKDGKSKDNIVDSLTYDSGVAGVMLDQKSVDGNVIHVDIRVDEDTARELSIKQFSM